MDSMSTKGGKSVKVYICEQRGKVIIQLLLGGKKALVQWQKKYPMTLESLKPKFRVFKKLMTWYVEKGEGMPLDDAKKELVTKRDNLLSKI